MGASVFETYGQGETALKVFNRLVEEARYDYGHAGYTGTIAEKNDFVMVSKEIFPSLKEASALANKLIDEDDERISDKWGPAGCVKFLKDGKTYFLFFGWASD